MSYIDTSSGDYPLTLQDILTRTPNTCWPEIPSPAMLAEHGFELVMPATTLTTPGMAVTEGAPTFRDGQWRQTWNEVPMTPTELIAAFEGERTDVIAGINADRDALLAAGAPYAGKRVQVDDRSRADLAGLMLAALLAQSVPETWGEGYSAGWIAMDNSRIPLPTPAAGIALASFVGGWYAAVIQAARSAKDAALAIVFDPSDPAGSQAKLHAFRTEAAWPD